MSFAEKEFVLKHVFKNVLDMKEGENNYSKIEEHFGVPWTMRVGRKADHLACYICCKQNQVGKWSIDARRITKVLSATGKSCSKTYESVFGKGDGESVYRGCNNFLKWDDLMKDYVVDDSIIVEIHVKIKKMSGIEKKKLRNFDESMEQYSDVVFIVNDQKFYVSKLFLARQSPYFNALLLGNFVESNKSEITLTGIETNDFQNFLEILYGEPAIDDETVNGILQLADMYDAKAVVRQCEEFLVDLSDKSPQEKLELATKYNFDELKMLNQNYRKCRRLASPKT